MRILVFGGTGMLGHKLVQTLCGRHEVWCTIRGNFENVSHFGIYDESRTICNLDVTDDGLVRTALAKIKPDVAICATGIVKQRLNDIVESIRVNAEFPQILARFAKDNNFRVINISTDCVFEGTRNNYSEEDNPDATSVYGRSKILGEITDKNCLTLRTSIIGRELFSRHGLIEWFLSNKGKNVAGYVNAVFSGFPTIVFADIISDLIVNHKQLSGLYHVSSEPISKFDLLRLVEREYSTDIEIIPEYDFRVDRSLDSAKFRGVTGFQPFEWDKMIRMMHDDPTPYDKWKLNH